MFNQAQRKSEVTARGGRRPRLSRFTAAAVLMGGCCFTACADEAQQAEHTARKSQQAVVAHAAGTSSQGTASCQGILQHRMQTLDEKEVSLCDYQGKVVLAVNTASFCGYTPQYEQLEALYQKYKDRGFVVLGFPANAFGAQEPGSNAEIKNFCEDKYHVSFPMFAKTKVMGKDANPFYQALIRETGQEPLWNFHKYLIDRQGKVLSYKSAVRPLSDVLTSQIEQAL